MQRLEVSVAVRPIYGSLGVKRLSMWSIKLLLFEIIVLKICDFILRTKFLLRVHVKWRVKTQKKKKY